MIEEMARPDAHVDLCCSAPTTPRARWSRSPAQAAMALKSSMLVLRLNTHASARPIRTAVPDDVTANIF
jgi:hypothetical protein